MRSHAPGGTINIKNCTFLKAAYKIFQVNRESTWNIINCKVVGTSTVLRQNGMKRFPMSVNIINLEATGIKEAIVRSDSPFCKVNYWDITTDLPKEKWWMGKLKAKNLSLATKPSKWHCWSQMHPAGPATKLPYFVLLALKRPVPDNNNIILFIPVFSDRATPRVSSPAFHP